jgi:hypothetical protein
MFGLAVGVFPSIVGHTEPLWMLAGFEAVVLFAAVIGLMTAIGRITEGQTLSAAMVAMTLVVAAVLASISANHTVAGFRLRPIVLGRVGLGGLAGLAAILLALRSSRDAVRLAVGGSLVAPPAVVAGLFVLGRAEPILSLLDGLGPVTGLSVWIVIGLAALAAIAAGGHLVITAFEPVDPPKPPSPRTE